MAGILARLARAPNEACQLKRWDRIKHLVIAGPLKCAHIWDQANG